MRVVEHPVSPNFSPTVIAVDFVVIHYTACSLERTLDIFYDPSKKVCAHFVIAENGDIHDLGKFWAGSVTQGAHAGKSHFEIKGQVWEALNQNSIGIELVNLNGNINPYPKVQFEALVATIKHLKTRFPALADPNRLVGHEQIAGFRGKSDPGVLFDWSNLFSAIYGNSVAAPTRQPRLSAGRIRDLADQVAQASQTDRQSAEFWIKLSKEIEASGP